MLISGLLPQIYHQFLLLFRLYLNALLYQERLFLSVARDGGIDDFCRHDGERLLMQGEYALRRDAGGDFLDLLLGEEDDDD